MNNLSVEEGNKLISEFDGRKRKYESTEAVFIENLKYHSSWDWLMPVVEKINKTNATQLNNYDYNRMDAADHSFVILLTKGKYWSNCPEGGSPDRIWGKSNSMIEAVWLAVVEFIKWYNKNNKP